MARALPLILLLFLAACARDPEPEPLPRFWTCGGVEFAVAAADGGLRLQLPGYDERLAADSDGGYRFGDFAFERDGDRATLTIRGTRHDCTPKRWDGEPWATARERGAVLRALGQEPGWWAEVVPGGAITLALDYGERTVRVPTPELTPLDGGARGYQVESGGQLVQVVIEPLVCFDSMSGHVFPETITVVVEGRHYEGCALPLVAN